MGSVRVGRHYWFMPRWDAVPRKVKVLLRLSSGDSCVEHFVVRDPYDGDTTTRCRNELYGAFQEAKDRLYRWVYRYVQEAEAGIKKLRQQKKETRQEIRVWEAKLEAAKKGAHQKTRWYLPYCRSGRVCTPQKMKILMELSHGETVVEDVNGEARKVSSQRLFTTERKAVAEVIKQLKGHEYKLMEDIEMHKREKKKAQQECDDIKRVKKPADPFYKKARKQAEEDYERGWWA